MINFFEKIQISKSNVYKIIDYNSFLDEIYPFYNSYLNYLENIFYLDASSFHKQQQLDNFRNIILSLRLYLNDASIIDKVEIVKYIKKTFSVLIEGFHENEFIYNYIDIFGKIMLSLEILFDYEELKNIFKYIIYIFLPYFVFGIYHKQLILENKKLNKTELNQKMNMNDLQKYIQENNKYILISLKDFLKNFAL